MNAFQEIYEDGVVFRTEVTTTDASLEVKANVKTVGKSLRVHEDTLQKNLEGFSTITGRFTPD